MASQRGFIVLETNTFEKFVEWELHPNVKITKVSEAGGDFIEAHFVNDGFNVESVLGKQGNAPFIFIETSRSGDELEDLSGVAAARSGVPLHELGTVFELEGIPVVFVVSSPAFGHRVEANGGPVGEDGIHAVLKIVLHAFVEFLEPGFVFFAAFGEALFADESVFAVLLAGGGIFRALGLREVGISRSEYVDSETESEALFETGQIMKVGCEQHEADVSLGRGYGVGQELGVLVGADFLNQLTELGLGFAFFAVREEAPLSVIDLIEKMHDVPAFGGHQGE